MNMLYVKTPEPNENCIETEEEEKSKRKGRFMKEESGRKRKKKFAGNQRWCLSPYQCDSCHGVQPVIVVDFIVASAEKT